MDDGLINVWMDVWMDGGSRGGGPDPSSPLRCSDLSAGLLSDMVRGAEG